MTRLSPLVRVELIAAVPAQPSVTPRNYSRLQPRTEMTKAFIKAVAEATSISSGRGEGPGHSGGSKLLKPSGPPQTGNPGKSNPNKQQPSHAGGGVTKPLMSTKGTIVPNMRHLKLCAKWLSGQPCGYSKIKGGCAYAHGSQELIEGHENAKRKMDVKQMAKAKGKEGRDEKEGIPEHISPPPPPMKAKLQNQQPKKAVMHNRNPIQTRKMTTPAPVPATHGLQAAPRRAKQVTPPPARQPPFCAKAPKAVPVIVREQGSGFKPTSASGSRSRSAGPEINHDCSSESDHDCSSPPGSIESRCSSPPVSPISQPISSPRSPSAESIASNSLAVPVNFNSPVTFNSSPDEGVITRPAAQKDKTARSYHMIVEGSLYQEQQRPLTEPDPVVRQLFHDGNTEFFHKDLGFQLHQGDAKQEDVGNQSFKKTVPIGVPGKRFLFGNTLSFEHCEAVLLGNTLCSELPLSADAPDFTINEPWTFAEQQEQQEQQEQEHWQQQQQQQQEVNSASSPRHNMISRAISLLPNHHIKGRILIF